MRFTILLLALVSAITLAATNAAVAPRPVASQKPQATSYKPQATSLGTESIAIPQMLSYQGKLTDTLGQPVPNNNYSVAFALYTVSSGGSPFWSETQSVATKAGLFSVLLGSVTPIGSIPDAGAVYLGMAVSGGGELTPRLRIASSAFAYLSARSANSDLLQGKDTTALDSRYVNEGQASSVTSNMIVDGTIAAVDLSQMGAATGQVMKWNGSAWVPRNDSVGQNSGGTVTSVTQATGVICTPNPITTTGTVGLDTTFSDGRYIKNQSGAYQTGSWMIAGQGKDSLPSGSGGAALYGTATGSNYGVWGNGTSYPGVEARAKTSWGALEAINYDSTQSGYTAGAAGHGFGGSSGAYGVLGEGANVGVYGTSTGASGVSGTSAATGYAGVYGTSTAGSGGYGVWGKDSLGYGVYGVSASNYGVYGNSSTNVGVIGRSTSTNGVYGTSPNGNGVYGTASAPYMAGVYGATTAPDSGHGIGVYGISPSYWGVQGYRANSQHGNSGYEEYNTRGGLLGYTYWGNPWTFGTAGYTFGDSVRTGGVIGAEYDGNAWGSLGYKNSSGNWYAGYGTSGWTSGSGLSSHPATGIGCGYGGGLMGGWLKGTYYGATVSGDRYALYTKGNNYTTGYSAVMQNTGGKREASYVPTSTTVDIYTSGVSEMKGGQATVSFTASFASMVSKNVPVVVTATPMGPAPIYLSSSDNNGFTVAAVDAKATGSVKFSWIAVGRRAGYETNPEVPAELTKTDFDSKMDGVMSNENDLQHSAQPVWFDGTQLRFDAPPQEPVQPKPAQPVGLGLNNPPAAPAPVVPASNIRPATSSTQRGTTALIPKPSSSQSTGVGK